MSLILQVQSDPTLPLNATWVGVMVIIAVGLIVAAACVGPIVRMNLPEDELIHPNLDEPAPSDTSAERRRRATRSRRRRA